MFPSVTSLELRLGQSIQSFHGWRATNEARAQTVHFQSTCSEPCLLKEAKNDRLHLTCITKEVIHHDGSRNQPWKRKIISFVLLSR